MSKSRNKQVPKDGAPTAKRARLGTPPSSEDDISDTHEENLSQVADFETGTEAEYGIIEHVSMKNFMCHKRLEFNFGPNVNFIVGRNGSGKSAVLTAIVVGLGGKATATNRGSSIKNFIKDTEQQAEITIKLRNRGLDSYKPEVYGSTIIVERRLKADGISSYKLRAKDGKVISQKYAELQQIKDQFNIQIDNPMSILNQDTSRNFLHSQDPKDKYSFFLKATQLEQMSNDYANIQQHRDMMQNTLSRKEEILPELQREVFQNEQRFKDLDSIQKLQKKREELLHMSAWAQVAAEEKVLDAMQKELRQEESRTPKFDEKIEASEAKVASRETHFRDLQDQLTELGEKIKELQPQHAMAKAEMDKAKRKERDVEKKIRSSQNQSRSLSADKNDLQQRISELKNSARRDYEDERKKREAEIQKLQAHIQAQEAQHSTVEQDLKQFISALDRAKEQTYGLKTRDADLKQNIDSKTRRIHHLEAGRKDRLKLYGDFMPNLLNEINKASQRCMFHQKPKGPIGNLLKLKDPRWAIGIEACLKQLLYKFCCHNYHDMNILNQLIARFVPDKKRRPGIIVSAFQGQRYDISQGAVRCEEYPSLLDMIDIEDPTIYNCLIDQRGVEGILLVESSQDARNLLRLQTPHNCREAFTLSGDQVYAGRDQRYYSNRYTKARVLRGDVEEDIREMQCEVQLLQQQQKDVLQQLRELDTTIRQNEQQKRRVQTQRLKLKQTINQLVYDKQQLEAIEDIPPVDVSTLEEEVATLDREIEANQAVLDDLGMLYKEIHREYDALKQRFSELDEEMKNFADRVEPIKDDVLTASAEIESAKNHLKHYTNKKKEHLDNLNVLKTRQDRHAKEVEVMVGKAKQIHPERVVTARKPQNIDSEIDQITKRIEKEQQSKGDPEQIIRRYDETKRSYLKIKKELTMFRRFIEKLDKLLEVRKGTFLVLRRHIALRTKHYFIMTLSKRGYNGKITFNHREAELHLTVQPTQGDGMGSQDMKSLSGGERSFSTVCFIMALWESMETPFRALDEFDVFMDMVNRRISMDLMLAVAKEQRMRQFIFLTPLDMSKITASHLLRISRMPDPNTGNQSVLNFEPVNRRNDGDED
ncbi:structural maintenance of chromosomes protein 6-like [Acanthaster planci]|uniref:Structural maintenance of chromosomes protein 6 n=1 Tax=Acanthaster planci TaxID=133434 RepID=A0A8B7YUT2_ACAPL|nr:structural maintenance of chromosomes protein 6-like [Acanthaster planci]